MQPAEVAAREGRLLAEGAQQQSRAMSKKHYRIALGSASEVAAALDLLEIYDVSDLDDGITLLNRLGCMLRVMSR